MLQIDHSEADTCRLYITPKLVAAGWDSPPYSMTQEKTFTDGRIVVTGRRAKRGKGKRVDYLLRYRPDIPIAVVEAKEYKAPAGTGLQQAKDYAEALGLKFAYATNGRDIIEFDFVTGLQSDLTEFPTPDELWERLRGGANISEQGEQSLLEASRYDGNKRPRYYQEIAINRAIQAITQGEQRVLLTMATGTGKTFVAFQICWKLWNSRWNRTGEYRRPRILFLADRNILVDDPKDKTFVAFGDARHKIETGAVVKSREMYFALYQAIAENEQRPGLYKKYAPDFFDLIIVDECHRGSVRDDSNWREILEYFEPAFQLGMTATPRRDDNADTYGYFGNPIYTYSLKQGIEDGFLAPYTVHRVVTDVDLTGWRPDPGQRDRYGREVPDQEYRTVDFDRELALKARTEAIARHITTFMKATGRFNKTIVFCVDQDHALAMQQALNNENTDLTAQFPNYVARITSDEGQIGRGLLSNFQDPEKHEPVIVTTSRLLTTGVDIPTCQNIVLVRVINSMTEFKQIIGRGTRVRDDYDKLYFNILDYTGTATRLFADEDFDGFPAFIEEIEIDDHGNVTGQETLAEEDPTAPPIEDEAPDLSDRTFEIRKYYVDDGEVEVVAEMVYYLDADGNRLSQVKYTDYTAERVRTLYTNSAEMRQAWAEPNNRSLLIEQLEESGIDFEYLARVTNQPDADRFDLLCHVAFNAPIRTRKERASRVYQEEQAFFEQFGPQARQILSDLLDKYAEHGTTQFVLPDILKVAPISEYGNVTEIIALFGGANRLRQAVETMQTLLYAA